jgi:hypothetical protein
MQVNFAVGRKREQVVKKIGEALTYDFVRLVGNPELPAIQNTAKRTATRCL